MRLNVGINGDFDVGSVQIYLNETGASSWENYATSGRGWEVGGSTSVCSDKISSRTNGQYVV
jgi:hypothetical protein